MSERQMRNRIKRACAEAGLGDVYSGHSTGIGMARDLVRCGTEIAALTYAGCWKSHPKSAYYTRSGGRRTRRCGEIQQRGIQLRLRPTAPDTAAIVKMAFIVPATLKANIPPLIQSTAPEQSNQTSLQSTLAWSADRSVGGISPAWRK